MSTYVDRDDSSGVASGVCVTTRKAVSSQEGSCQYLGRFYRSPWMAVAILFILSLVPRVYFYVSSGPYGMVNVAKDASQYLSLASTLWSDGNYATARGELHCTVAPMYSIFLAPFVGTFGNPPREALWFQVFLSAAMPCLCYWIARRIKGDLAGWLAGLFAVAYLPPAAYASRFLTENLAIPLFLIGLLLGDSLLRRQAKGRGEWFLAFLLGVAFALQSLTRFVCLPLLLVSLAVVGLSRLCCLKSYLGVAATACLGFCVAYSPWVIRNYLAYDKVIVTRYDERVLPAKQVIGYVKYEKAETIHEARRGGTPAERLRLRQRYKSVKDYSEFSIVAYARQTWLRLEVMLGSHRLLFIPFPFAGRRFSGNPVVQWENYLWTPVMWICVLVALVWVFRKRDVRAFHAVALPFGLIGCYSLVHAIPRYQTIPYVGLTIAAGIGLSVILGPLGRKLLRARASVDKASE